MKESKPIRLSKECHKAAKVRASILGKSMREYLDSLVREDILNADEASLFASRVVGKITQKRCVDQSSL